MSVVSEGFLSPAGRPSATPLGTGVDEWNRSVEPDRKKRPYNAILESAALGTSKQQC
jgi:hypothetical protein